MSRRVLEPGEVVIPLIEEMGCSQECSACNGQNSGIRYFDFDAAVDRGWYAEEQIVKDDLVICEICLEEAMDKMGWSNDEKLKEFNKTLASQLEREKKRADKAEEYAARLEGVFDSRPEKIRVDHRHKPRPARTGAA